MRRRLPLLPTRAVPWLMLLQAAQVVWRHYQDDLDDAERRRLRELLRRPPHRLTIDERGELRRIVRRFPVGRMGAEIAFGRRRRGVW